VKKKIKTGKIYGIFPVEIIDDAPYMTDCFINNNFMWLFECMNEIEYWACAVLGIDHMFIIKLDKK
jgi:hypothetical protein